MDKLLSLFNFVFGTLVAVFVAAGLPDVVAGPLAALVVVALVVIVAYCAIPKPRYSTSHARLREEAQVVRFTASGWQGKRGDGQDIAHMPDRYSRN